MVENKWFGSKTNQGFYKKVDRDILSLDLDTMEYRPAKKVAFPTLELTKSIDKPIDRFRVLIKGKDKAGEFYRKSFSNFNVNNETYNSWLYLRLFAKCGKCCTNNLAPMCLLRRK